MQKQTNPNRMFESNKYTPSYTSTPQQKQNHKIDQAYDLEASITTCPGSNSTKQTSYEDESRRSSGNSITIRITNAENVIVNESSLENILNENYVILNEKERRDDHEIDAEEDTTSLDNNDLDRSQSKRKLKGNKKFVRSIAQQKHHLEYQESEDQPEVIENTKKAFSSQNSAFDELFAAANTGNFIQSAHVEAKMAIAASKKAADNEISQEQEEENAASVDANNRFPYNSNYNKRSSFINRCSFKKAQHTETNHSSKPAPATDMKQHGIEVTLGTPLTPLIRSQSCKRPGSFKRMRGRAIANNTNEPNTKASPAVSGRRGTHGSINLTELEKSRCDSMPLENNLAGEQQQEDSEILRVRQFNITNKGVVNRGDSFKRSFKRSNNSISSKKDVSPTQAQHPTIHVDGNTLSLPDTYDGYIVNKSSTNNSVNYGNEVISQVSSDSNCLDDKSISMQKMVVPAVEAKTYLVYMLGASSVGKNALIKQFKTSEYRGTYDIDSAQVIDDSEEGVTIALDGVESILHFVSMDIDMLKLSTSSLFEITKDNDAFVVVYSISDKASFNIAIDLLKSVRLSESRNQPVILVGNKSDLVRKRSISRDDARKVASKFSCKFVETSVAINDKVDDLLAGILKQIRLHEANNLSENDTETSFIEGSNHKHSRNYSDTQVDDFSKMNSKFSNRTMNRNFMSFRTNALTRRLFGKNKENATPTFANNPYSDSDKKKFAKIHYSDQQSFFHKIFNNIFKKRSENAGSVENLYTPPNLN